MKCQKCGGTGIEDVIWHQDEKGNSEMEPVRCENCDVSGEVSDND